MTGLSHEAKDLLARARHADVPAPADREPNRLALQAAVEVLLPAGGAVAQGWLATALPRALAAECRRRYPDGALSTEVEAVSLLASCAAGSPSREAAARWLASAPRSPLAGRVTASAEALALLDAPSFTIDGHGAVHVPWPVLVGASLGAELTW